MDRRPAALALCASREDVAGAVALAAERGLPVGVRCGATSDQAALDGGVLIDVSAMKGVDVDPSARIARVGGGLTWAEMDTATQEHGLAVTGGRLSALGVAGVTLCDGSGWLERSLGPTCLSLTAAEVVLADGQVVEASPEQNPDLLWALRGGGGGLGVVTELEFRLHPVGPTLLSGFLTFPRERAEEVARFYRDYMQSAPDEVGGGLVLGAGSGGACTIYFCHLGAVEQGEEAFAPLRELGPSMDAVGPNEYRAFQAAMDLQNPFGARAHLRGRFLRELSDEALESGDCRRQPARGEPLAGASCSLWAARWGAQEGKRWHSTCQRRRGLIAAWASGLRSRASTRATSSGWTDSRTRSRRSLTMPPTRAVVSREASGSAGKRLRRGGAGEAAGDQGLLRPWRRLRAEHGRARQVTPSDKSRAERGGPATIKDVAALAEVSETTVSNALNGKGRLRLGTRERVAAAARELGYRPSRAAQALRTRRTGILAFLLPAFESAPPPERRLVAMDVYMTQATAAAHAAFAHDHALLLVPPSASEPDLAALGVDGGIVCDPSEDDSLVALLTDFGLPVVTIEQDPGELTTRGTCAPTTTPPPGSCWTISSSPEQGGSRF